MHHSGHLHWATILNQFIENISFEATGVSMITMHQSPNPNSSLLLNLLYGQYMQVVQNMILFQINLCSNVMLKMACDLLPSRIKFYTTRASTKVAIAMLKSRISQSTEFTNVTMCMMYIIAYWDGELELFSDYKSNLLVVEFVLNTRESSVTWQTGVILSSRRSFSSD